MGIVIKENKLFFHGLFFINLLISMLAFAVLPERFFNDANYIVQPALHGNEEIGSYGFTIAFYKNTFLSYLHFSIIALIQYTILIFALYKVGLPSNFHKINARNIIIHVSFFMLAIFVSMPSKEFITFLFIVTIPYLYQSRIPSKYKIILSMLFLVGFGLIFRIYFILIPIIAIGMYLISFIKFKNKIFATFFYGILIAVFLSLSHGLIKGEFLSETSREAVNIYRKNMDVNSMVVSPVRTDVWYGETIGIFNGFLSVNLPIIEGVKHILSPQIISFIIWQLALFYILIVRYIKCLNNRRQRKYEMWSILIVFAYFIVQGVFEPDLGTATRHKVAFLPLIYFIFYYDYIGKKPL
ncbi:hypothetical protein [Flavobacterium sp. SM2513]|uniref:hypothetical protein n=1 Tax=Flavobacterium sp. SM2513 TaxID=3424766 RepID=UPI003D7FA32A